MRPGLPPVLWIIGITATVVAAMAVGWLVLVELPSRLSDVSGLTVAERTSSQNAIRATLAQLLGGVFVAGGLLFTARTFQLTRESQITERYTTAITQLGDVALHVRIGGIYALERIANDSRRDIATITTVLCAFVRSARGRSPSTGPAADTRAALEVVARLPGADKPRELDLRGAKLAGLRLPSARLAGADLTDATLERAQLSKADLRDATLTGANLSRATISGSDLSGAHLQTRETNLSGATCTGVDFSRSQLDGANLVGAVLTGSDLRGTSLVKTDLGSAVLEGSQPQLVLARGARFDDAIFAGTLVRGIDLSSAIGLSATQKSAAVSDDHTRWPSGMA